MSGLDRRAFLTAAAATGVGLAMASLPALDAVAAPVTGSARWSAATFLPYLGGRFALAGGGAVRLVEVLDRGGPFVLILAPVGGPRREGTYTLRHPALGTFVLGLTSVGRSGRLQAVIDQRRPSGRQKWGQHV